MNDSHQCRGQNKIHFDIHWTSITRQGTKTLLRSTCSAWPFDVSSKQRASPAKVRLIARLQLSRNIGSSFPRHRCCSRAFAFHLYLCDIFTQTQDSTCCFRPVRRLIMVNPCHEPFMQTRHSRLKPNSNWPAGPNVDWP